MWCIYYIKPNEEVILPINPTYPQTTENVAQIKGHELRLENRVVKELHSDIGSLVLLRRKAGSSHSAEIIGQNFSNVLLNFENVDKYRFETKK